MSAILRSASSRAGVITLSLYSPGAVCLASRRVFHPLTMVETSVAVPATRADITMAAAAKRATYWVVRLFQSIWEAPCEQSQELDTVAQL